MAFAFGKAPSLDSLVLGWPRDRASADLAYLLSATAVEYLIHESGERGLRLFLERWKAGRRFDLAFQGVYGLTPDQFECVYGNIPRFGLAAAADHIQAVGRRDTVCKRLGYKNTYHPVTESS